MAAANGVKGLTYAGCCHPPATFFQLEIFVPLPTLSLQQNRMSGYSLTLFCQNDLSEFKYLIVRDLRKKPKKLDQF